MKPADIAKYTATGDPQLSPDGRHVAFVVQRVDAPGNTYRSRIWIAATDGSSAPRPLTAGSERDANPRWSPSGDQLAFTSQRAKGPDGKPRNSVHLLPFETPGETVLLAEGPEGFSGLTFSPDGSLLAYVTRTRGPHYDNDEVAARPPRKIDNLNFMLNGEGFIIDRPQHVWVIPTDGSADAQDLTPGPRDASQPSWFPDSQRLAVFVNEFRTNFATDVGVVEVASDASADDDWCTLLTDGTGFFGHPVVSPDGTQVAVSGCDDVGTMSQNLHIGLLEVGAVGRPKWLTTSFDRTWWPFVVGQPPTWTSAGIHACVEDRGNFHLFHIDPEGVDQLTPVVTGDQGVFGWSVHDNGDADPSSQTLAWVASHPTQPPEVWSQVDGTVQQLTTVSHAYVTATKPVAPHQLLATSGDVEVDTWVYLPPNFDPAESWPMLLNIHGGPFTQYGNYYFDEFQMQAAAGYIVVCSNPRGSSGRDQAWGHSILGPKHKVEGTGWGSVDFDDVMAVLDAALAAYPSIDTDRLGVLGGSYGGYLTSWIVTHSNRFAAACSERSANNLLTLEYGSDIAGAFNAEIGPLFVDDPDEYARMSPVNYVKDLDTPLLIIHSEEDLRCPVEQATQLFVACKILGKEVEYWLFPGETHELSRSGSPTHRVQRGDLILEYFNRHLAAS